MWLLLFGLWVYIKSWERKLMSHDEMHSIVPESTQISLPPRVPRKTPSETKKHNMTHSLTRSVQSKLRHHGANGLQSSIMIYCLDARIVLKLACYAVSGRLRNERFGLTDGLFEG